MPVAEIDPVEFWNQKILQWERDRYQREASGRSALEALAFRFSGLPQRMANAQRILAQNIVDKNVAEIGCGSGLMAEQIIEMGARSYQGFDIASAAVEEARSRVNDAKLGDKIQFDAMDVSSITKPDADVVFSLGLLDWLQPEQIDSVFQISSGAEFLHSFSERRVSIWRYLHSAYVYAAYAHSTGPYKPQYHSYEEIESLARRHTERPTFAFRDNGMRFGCFITTLEC